MNLKRIPISDQDFASLKNKAESSICTYRISAVAYDKKGDVLGYSSNKHSDNKNVRSGTGVHAERVLLRRYKNLVKTIVICRVGHSGALLPIEPCPVCKKVAAKFGAKIISVNPGDKPYAKYQT